MSRNAYAPCDEVGCDRSPANGDVLYRVNPKGEIGVFMCQQHRDAVWAQAKLVRCVCSRCDGPGPRPTGTNCPECGCATPGSVSPDGPEFGPFCSHCGGDRIKRWPADPDGYGCAEDIYHFEMDPPDEH